MKGMKFIFIVLVFMATAVLLNTCGGGGGSSGDGSSGPLPDYGDSATHEIIFVSTNGDDGTGDGTKGKPYETIDHALSLVSSPPARINMTEGSFDTAGISLTTNVSIFGGYKLGFGARDTSTYFTDIVSSCVSSCTHVIKTTGLNNSTKFDGYRLTGGGGAHSNGIWNVSSSPAINDVDILGGQFTNLNYAIYNDSSSPAISNSNITGGENTTNSYGIYNTSSSPNVTNNTIKGGTGPDFSYGVYNTNSSGFFTNNTIDGGSGGTSSTGILDNISSSEIKNNNINGGSSPSSTNGIFVSNSTSLITNNTINGGTYSNATAIGVSQSTTLTIVNNLMYAKGNAIIITSSSTPDIINNTIYAVGNGILPLNSAPVIANNIIISLSVGIFENTSGSPAAVSHNNVLSTPAYKDVDLATLFRYICDGAGNLSSSGTFGNSDCSVELTTPLGIGNIYANPFYSNFSGSDGDITTMADNDWHLTASSPVSVTEGADSTGNIFTDKDGNARTVPWSMGAFEF